MLYTFEFCAGILAMFATIGAVIACRWGLALIASNLTWAMCYWTSPDVELILAILVWCLIIREIIVGFKRAKVQDEIDNAG